MNLSSDEKQDIIETLKQAIPILQAVYVFGSRQDGTATTQSDIDIAYLSDETLGAVARWEIAQNLASVLSYDVDLVDLRQTDTIFRYQIISKGTRIYGEGYEVESFETLAYSFYLRFQEERRPIVEAIIKRQSVSGGMHV